MVNLGNFFGARGRKVDPNSARQLALACKAQDKVLDKASGQCRDKLKRGRAPSAGPTLASLRAACKAQGLVLADASGACRESRRGSGLVAARAARAAARGGAPTIAQMREACKAQGLVFDTATKQCRAALPKGRKAKTTAFGARTVNPNSARQLAMACKAQGKVLDKASGQCRDKLKPGRARPAGAGPTIAELRAACKAQGLVLDMETNQCRASRRGAGLVAARAARAAARGSAPTIAQMREACKAQGLVFDTATKQCRAALPKGRKKASAFGASLFNFGVNRPAAAQRAGIIYSTPASTLTSPEYGIIGPVSGKVTGPASFQVRSSTVSPAMMKELGVAIPNIPASTSKAAPATKPAAKSSFGTKGKAGKGMVY